MPPHFCTPRELTASPPDVATLERFYRTVYVQEFPDADERESFENMAQYLAHKAAGWYQDNAYHILLYLDGDEPVAGVIVDYLAGANVGVIEFLVVSPAFRRAGLGSALLTWAERTLREDSRRAARDGWAFLLAEMNDPFKSIATDSMDPFERALVWHRWGFQKARFPYVQPSLSPHQEPVRTLLLMCKPADSSVTRAVPSPTLRDAVYGYARWAMRIDDPDHNAECREMARHLAVRDAIGLQSLAAYAGAGSSRRLTYRELTAVDGPEIGAVLALYRNEFGDGPTALAPYHFTRLLAGPAGARKDFDYHLLSISPRAPRSFGALGPGEAVRGMASFFTLPGARFGGYIALDPGLRGQGHLAEVITVMERRMASDRRGARGWYGECEPGRPALQILQASGFHEVDIGYRQPPLPSGPAYSLTQAPVLHLVYKEFGEAFSPPRLTVEDFLDALRWIYRIVYGVDRPEDSEYYREVEQQLNGRSLVAWKIAAAQNGENADENCQVLCATPLQVGDAKP